MLITCGLCAGLLFAGLNSAKELVYILTMLACHPELQRKARAEVDALYSSCCASAEVGPHLGEPTASGEDAARSVRAHVREPSFDELWTATSLPYCSKLVLEALRLSPGVEHMRVRASADMWYPTSSGTLFFPSGLPFVISPSLLHRHPRYWSSADKPLAALFDSPGRAPPGDSKTTSDLESSTLLSQGDNSGGKFLPFSAGPKGCIASQFAMYEMRMVLVCMLKRFELHQGLQAPGGLHRVQLTPR
ncbi:hypothetical protein AB1Y20_022940 [Prymnesium parvum]|uniref:Cytochrome P450 n=1 Tax=Prymnesium parvum TaxID=97485 RepID=A0AB34JCY6_PRYPA